MWWLAAALLAPLLTLALGWQIGRWQDDPGHLGDIQHSALWQPLFAHSRRAAIVVGTTTFSAKTGRMARSPG
jgi:hypothetical protein